MDLTNFVVRVANSEEDKMPVVFENMLRHCAEEADMPKENVNSWIRDIWEMIKSRPNEVAAFAAPVAGAGLGAYVGRKWNPYLSALAGGSLGAAGGSVLDPSLGFALLADIVKRILPEEKKSNKEKKDSKEKKDNKEKDQKGASEKSSSAIENDAKLPKEINQDASIDWSKVRIVFDGAPDSAVEGTATETADSSFPQLILKQPVSSRVK